MGGTLNVNGTQTGAASAPSGRVVGAFGITMGECDEVTGGAIGCIIYSDPRDDGYAQGDVYPKGGWRPPEGVQRGSGAVHAVQARPRRGAACGPWLLQLQAPADYHKLLIHAIASLEEMEDKDKPTKLENESLR